MYIIKHTMYIIVGVFVGLEAASAPSNNISVIVYKNDKDAFAYHVMDAGLELLPEAKSSDTAEKLLDLIAKGLGKHFDPATSFELSCAIEGMGTNPLKFLLKFDQNNKLVLGNFLPS